MVPSELTRRVSMGELLVLLVCWKSGPYGVPDQQGDKGKLELLIPYKPRGASPLGQFLLVGPLFLCVEKVRGRK